MEDVIYYLFSLSKPIDIVIFSHVCQSWYKIAKPFKRPYDILYEAIAHYPIKIVMYLYNYNYSISNKSVYLAIQKSQFKLVDLLEKGELDQPCLLYALKSNNVKMVRFV